MAATAKPATSVEQVARSYFEAINSHDVEAAVGHWHSEGIEDIVPTRIYRGIEEIRGFVAGIPAALPDVEMQVVRVTADERVAVLEWRLSGTFTGARFEGIDPTGSRIELRGVDCIEVEDGKIVRNTAYYDAASFARQVGMLPRQESSGERAMTSAFNGATKLRAMVRDQMGR